MYIRWLKLVLYLKLLLNHINEKRFEHIKKIVGSLDFEQAVRSLLISKSRLSLKFSAVISNHFLLFKHLKCGCWDKQPSPSSQYMYFSLVSHQWLLIEKRIFGTIVKKKGDWKEEEKKAESQDSSSSKESSETQWKTADSSARNFVFRGVRSSGLRGDLKSAPSANSASMKS